MSARVTILCGPARSGKTGRLLARYREALRQRPPGSALWLAPNWRVAADVRGRLLDGTLAGCFAPGVMTFAQYAQSVLRAAQVPIRPINPLMKRELIRQLIASQSSAGRLRHFQSIAKTPGLVDLVCEFIGELKRLEIWPDEFRRACEERGGLAEKDRELAEIYDAYQQALREHDLFDAEGRFWSARDVLQRGEGRGTRGEGADVVAFPLTPRPSPLIPLLVVADGFTDFTRTQHEILDVLAARAEEMFVSLPLEAQPRRADLFAKPLDTLERLRRRYANATVEEAPRPSAADWPAMAHLERTLFVNPRAGERLADGMAACNGPRADVPSAAKRSLGIEILAAARQIGEIEMIAARVKRLLADGQARPGEIAVVFRSPQQAGELVQEVFGRLGIPVAFESGQTLDRSPALRVLATLLQLDRDDWPFDRLLAVLGSNYFVPDWPEWRAADAVAVQRAIRTLQIPHGRQRLIEQLADAGDASYKTTLALVQCLAGALDALPQRATLPEWAKAWAQLAEETGLLRAMVDSQPSPFPLPPSPFVSDRRVWDRLMESLAEGGRLAAWLLRRPPELDRRSALDALLDVLASDRIGHGGDESGRVRVLGAESVRSLRIPYLFLAGLSEKVFPPPDREDRLYSEAEYARLIEAGLPLVARTERTREEMLLFYEAVTRATKRLWLSYPALDETAQPLLPSPFLSEVEQAFGPGTIPRIEQTDLSPIPRNVAGTRRVPECPHTECADYNDDEPLCQADFRVRAVATALEGNVSLLAGLFGGREERLAAAGTAAPSPKADVPSAAKLPSPLADNLAAGLELIYLRQDRDRFGPAEGLLQGEAARQRLAALFSPQHTFAATDLEHYASCPFRFFLERILKIEPVEDLTLEFDVLRRGRVVHDVLGKFHQRVNERLGRPASPLELDTAEFDALLAAAIADSLPPEPPNPLQAAMREIDRRLVIEWLSQYRGQLEVYDAQWKEFDAPLAPELFEVSFGRGGPPPLEFPIVDAASCRVPELKRQDAASTTVRISGRIDRIDTGTVAGRQVFNVLDYKTGGPIAMTPETVKAGTTLQLPLYALAAMELLLADRDALPWQAGYWYVREGGFKPRRALRMYSLLDGRIELDAAWEEIRAGLGDTVAGLAGGIRAGRFPVCSADDHCTGRCPYSTICRINQVRSLEKTCQPTATE